jgi:putative transposase
MDHAPDKCSVDEAAWREAVARETVVRKLLSMGRPSRSDVLRACRELDVKRTRLYELIKTYRERPVTSSLLVASVGRPQGTRLLSTEMETVIAEALRVFYKTRQKPSINRLLKEVQRLCRLRGLKPPSWHALRLRIAAIDPAELTCGFR